MNGQRQRAMDFWPQNCYRRARSAAAPRVNRSGGRPGYSGTSTETLGTPTREERRVQVLVRDNNVDQALKALKKKMQREKAEAIRRARKLARKRAQREGLIPGKPKPAARPGR